MFYIKYQQDDTVTQKSVKVMVPVTSQAQYRELRNSKQNLATLTQAREMYDHYRSQASEGADMQSLKELKDKVDHQKAKLVQFNYSCIPNADMHLKGSTQLSPWVGMDVDFDPTDPLFEQKMAEAPQRIISMAGELGLGMLERSVGKGYHIAFRRHLDKSQEDNLKWASGLIGCQYDTGAKDITRVFFSTSSSDADLLYLSDEMFSEDANQPVQQQLADASATVPASTTSGYVTTSTANTIHPSKGGHEGGCPSAHFYEEFSFAEIITTYWKLFNGGKEPNASDHNRNALTFDLATHLRCIRDFKPERVMEVIPIYDGLSVEEWQQTIVNACNQPRKGLTYRMRKVLEELKKERKSQSASWSVTSSQPPLLTSRMPESLRKIAALAPDFLKTTVAEGAFAALATHLHGVTFESIDGKICEPAFMQIIINRQSSGKGCVDMPIECINADLLRHDSADRLREDEWKQNNPTGAKKKEKFPEDIYVQTCQSDMTHAGFVKRLMQCERNGGRPLFIHMVELDEITALSTNGRNDVTRIVRKAFDRSSYGQERAGSESISGVAPLRLNFTAATTPARAISMCQSWVPDGTLSRCNLITIDPNVNNEKVKYKKCTQRYKDSLAPFIDRLNNSSGLIRSKRALDLAERLSDELDDMSASTGSDSIKTFGPRAVTIAYWKAMILYIMAGQKWSKDIENYVVWSLKRDIWTKMHFFGRKLEDDLERENSIETYHPKNILDILHSPFSEEDFIQARRQLGLKGNYKEHLKKLRQRGKIVFDETIHMYAIIAQDNNTLFE